MKLSKSALAFIFAIGIVPLPSIAQNLPSDLPPPNAKPGQCYARVLVPAKYDKIPVEVSVSDGYKGYNVIEPKFKPERIETRTTQDAYTEFKVTEPKWNEVQETIITIAAHKLVTVTEPVKTNVLETYVIKEPRFVWRPGKNLSSIKRMDTNTGDVFCLVEERGITETVRKTTFKGDAIVNVKQVPAKTETYIHKVLIEDAKAIPVTKQALSKDFKVRDLESDGDAIPTTIQGTTKTIYREQLVQNEHYEWALVDCDNSNAKSVNVDLSNSNQDENYNAPTNYEIQKRLAKLGFYRGPLDDIYGRLTTSAMAKFQAANGLNATGKPDSASLKALGF